MNLEMPYGHEKITVELPDHAEVLRGVYKPGLENETAAVLAALRQPIGSPPLRELVRAGQSAVIVHSDITRATPNERILPVIIKELEDSGVNRSDITLLCALGTHRKQTEAENRRLVGDFLADHYACLQHDCYDKASLQSIGVTSFGNPVSINKVYLNADIRILTGFIEPHFFAGFSGGPKGVLPSIAGMESVLSNHSYKMIADPKATWGVTEGNPIWEEMREAALRTSPTFLVNVALNRNREISAVFAGEMIEAHRQGCEFVRNSAMIKVDRPYDIAITTNGGYPLDQNLYQTLKGISAAERAVHSGGTILIFSACQDGLPDHGMYAKLLKDAGSPQRMLEMLAKPDFFAPDQWQTQIQAQILLDHSVYVYSDGLSDQQISEAMYKPCRDIPATLREILLRYPADSRICVIPEGPEVIPYQ